VRRTSLAASTKEDDESMRTAVSPELRVALEGVADELSAEFSGTLSRETIARYVEGSAEAFVCGATVTRFIPILVQRFARERLRALAQAEGAIAKAVPEVLFVCVHNAGRSQMAAALLDHHGMGRVHVRSAGSAPPTRSTPWSFGPWPRWDWTPRRSSPSR
jgi:arsenate reductase